MCKNWTNRVKEKFKKTTYHLLVTCGGTSLKTLITEFRKPDIINDTLHAKTLARKTFLWILATEIVVVLEPLPIKLFFDGMAQQNVTFWYLLGVSAIGFILALLNTTIHGEMEKHRHNFFWHTWSMLWSYGHKRQQLLSVDWHTHHGTGEKESLIERAIDKIIWLFDEIIFNAVPRMFRITLVCIGVWFLGVHFGVIAVLVGLLVFWKIIKDNKKLQTIRTAFRERIKQLERFGNELTSNWHVIKQFGLENKLCGENDRLLKQHRDKEGTDYAYLINLIRQQGYIICTSKFLMFATIALFMFGMKEIGTIVLATAWMEKIFSNLHQFNDVQRKLHEGGEALNDFAQVLSLTPSVRQPAQSKWPKKLQGHITLHDVSFQYPASNGYALSDINLVIEPYQCVALVGPSGGGKSTLAALMQREYDPTTGLICIDGVPLHNFNYNRLRQEALAVVSQKVQLFTGTIADNIRLAAPHISDDEVRMVLKKSYLLNDILSWPLGIHTQLGEDGINLSGGQRQRLAIARALARNPKILILDEATSSLDAQSQEYISKVIADLKQSRLSTIIIIAHRFSTIRQADKVVVLNKGTVAEIGTHEQLERKNGIYKRLKNMERKGLLD